MKIYKKRRWQVSRRQGQGRKSGSVIIEGVVAFIFLLLPLTLGIMQFGAFYSAGNAVSQVAREAGRLAAIYGNAADDPATTTINEGSDDYLQSRIREVFNATALPSSQMQPTDFTVTITPTNRAQRLQYSQISVFVRYNMDLKSFPLFKFFKPGFVTRTSYTMLEKKENTVVKPT